MTNLFHFHTGEEQFSIFPLPLRAVLFGIPARQTVTAAGLFFGTMFMVSLSAMAQTGVHPVPPAKPVQQNALYEGLFRNLATIQVKSDALDRSFVDGGASMRRTVCGQIKLNTSDCNRMFVDLKGIAAQLTALDRRALKIINDVRAQHKDHPRNKLVPGIPVALTQLQNEKKSLIEASVAKLMPRLSQNGAYALRTYATSGVKGNALAINQRNSQ